MPTTRHRRSAPPAQLAPSTDGSLRVVLIGDQNDEAALFRDAIDAHPGARLAAVVAPDPTRLRLRTTADDVPTLLTVQELFTRRFPADLLVNVHPKATPSTFMRDALRRGYSVFSNGPGNIGVAEFRKRLKQAGEANRAAVVLDPYRAMVTSALRLAGTDAFGDVRRVVASSWGSGRYGTEPGELTEPDSVLRRLVEPLLAATVPFFSNPDGLHVTALRPPDLAGQGAVVLLEFVNQRSLRLEVGLNPNLTEDDAAIEVWGNGTRIEAPLSLGDHRHAPRIFAPEASSGGEPSEPFDRFLTLPECFVEAMRRGLDELHGGPSTATDALLQIAIIRALERSAELRRPTVLLRWRS